MPVLAMPAVDVEITNTWSQQELDLYNSLPYFFAKMQVERRKHYVTWKKFLGTRKWQPNQGHVMRLVRKVPSPHIRQFAFPRLITDNPKKDMSDVRETTVDMVVRRHRFESQQLNFVPNFRDFMTDHVEAQGKDILEKQERFEDIYYRGSIFHQSPYAFVCTKDGVKLLKAPSWNGLTNFDSARDGKTADWIKGAVLPIMDSSCTMLHLNQMLQIAETNLGLVPFSGSQTPADSAGLSDKFCFLTSTEKWNQFTFDPWLTANKNINLDIVTKGFRGDIFGRITTKFEDLPLRFKDDATFPEPELRVAADSPIDPEDTVPNPDYAEIKDDGALGTVGEIGFFIAQSGYDAIPVGPPPSAFASDNPPDNFAKMFWNGEIKLTKKFLIPVVGDDGSITGWEMNTYGENLKYISQATYGLVGRNKKSIIPVFYLRQRGA